MEEIENIGFRNIPEFKLRSFFDLNFLRQLWRCVAYIRHNRIDIVQTYDFYTNVFGILAARIGNVRLKIASKRETGGMRSRSQRAVERFVFRLSDVIVANSDAVKRYLVDEGIPARKINVVYNGLNLERRVLNGTGRQEICAELGLPCDSQLKFVTLVANLRHTVKNHAMFLRAAALVLDAFPEVHFVLAGEGELRDDLESLAAELNVRHRTHFIGRCTNVHALLSISFAGVLTSFAEGFANSIIEYMAAGLPVIATDVGGAAEAIEHVRTGFLIESTDHRALAEKVIWLLENPNQAAVMGKRGRRIVEQKFSLEAQLRDTVALYEGTQPI